MMEEFSRNRTDSKLRKITAWILFISLLGSIIYVAIRLAGAPRDSAHIGDRLKSDYLLMLVQCSAGLAVMFLPAIISKRFRLSVPNYMFVLFYIFLYGAIFLGEVRSFYYKISFWDSILHAFSAAMLGSLGFSVVYLLNSSTSTQLNLSPFFLGVFSFCFALAIGTLWEIYEFSLDALLGMNMQKYALEGGEALVGQAALADTMKDLIIDACGALTASIVGTITLRRNIREGNTIKGLIIHSQK